MIYRLYYSFFILLALISTSFALVRESSLAPDDVAKESSKRGNKVEISQGKASPNTERYFALIDSIAQEAEYSALNSKFADAHTMFAKVQAIVNDEKNENLRDTLFNNQQIIDRISRFYIEMMPPYYLDSIPSSFAPYVARHQFYAAMDAQDTNVVLDTTLLPLLCNVGEPYNIPITYNRRVQQALRVALSPERRKRIETLLTRAAHYRPMMNQIFMDAGIPTDLTYLPIIESAFQPKAYSFAHASGLWQFIPGTGRDYKLRQDYWVDERRDPIRSTIAAAAYLGRLYKMFDDWYLALASYNTGEGRVSRVLRSTPGATSYWDLRLPAETMNYVPLYITNQMIAKNPQCFGITVRDTTEFPYDTVQVSQAIELSRIAQATNISTSELQNINPHILKWCTPPSSSKTTLLYLPKGQKEAFYALVKSLKNDEFVQYYRYQVLRGDNIESVARKFNVSASSIVSINQMSSVRLLPGRYIIIPLTPNMDSRTASLLEKMAKEEQEAIAKIPTTTVVRYKVRRGDTLSKIARLYNVSVQDLMRWNNLRSTKALYVGTLLKVQRETPVQNYVSKEHIAPIADSAAIMDSSQDTSTSTLPETSDSLTITQATDTVTPPIQSGSLVYIVKKGETLSTIASLFRISIQDLMEWNSITNPNNIFVGKKLTIYNKESAPKKVPSVITQDTVKSAVLSPSQTTPKQTTTIKNTTPEAATTAKKSTFVIHTVKKGEALSRVAEKYQVTMREVMEWNKISNPNNVHIGAKLKIYTHGTAPEVSTKTTATAPVVKPKPSGTPIIYIIKQGETLSKVAGMYGVTIQELLEWNDIANPEGLHVGSRIKVYNQEESTETAVATAHKGTTYTIKSGETLSKVATLYNVSVQDLMEWNNISDPQSLFVGAVVKVYDPKVTVASTTAVAATKETQELGTKQVYTVVAGDNLYGISRTLGVSMADLAKWNKKNTQNPVVMVGEKLVYYGGAIESTKQKSTRYVVKPGDTIYGIGRLFAVKPEAIKKANNLRDNTIQVGDTLVIPAATASTQGEGTNKLVTYKVKSGDNLWSIANAFKVSVREICIASNISQQKQLHVGETLTIPITQN